MAELIYVLSGPNLNLLGEREPKLYGHETLADLQTLCRQACERHGLDLVFHQSNAEHDLVGWIQETRKRAAGLVINPAGFCYYSVAILDALRMCDCPVIEVHISHIHAREPEWRSKTITAAASHAMISGMGVHGYALAIDHLAHRLKSSA
ncbi:MAG TPA: type II 3-dehydroquinate dehydratase [Caulobacteraceae bacterium]|nr:type II 3-dehydroquinate dehydratase [Caulobacteraceae bacterium]